MRSPRQTLKNPEESSYTGKSRRKPSQKYRLQKVEGPEPLRPQKMWTWPSARHRGWIATAKNRALEGLNLLPDNW